VVQESQEIFNYSEHKDCQPSAAVSKTESRGVHEYVKLCKTSYCRRVLARERLKRLRQNPDFLERSYAFRRKKYQEMQLEKRCIGQSKPGSELESAKQDIPWSVNKVIMLFARRRRR